MFGGDNSDNIMEDRLERRSVKKLQQCRLEIRIQTKLLKVGMTRKSQM